MREREMMSTCFLFIYFILFFMYVSVSGFFSIFIHSAQLVIASMYYG